MIFVVKKLSEVRIASKPSNSTLRCLELLQSLIQKKTDWNFISCRTKEFYMDNLFLIVDRIIIGSRWIRLQCI